MTMSPEHADLQRLVGRLDPDQVRALFRRFRGPVIVPDPIVTEVAYFLQHAIIASQLCDTCAGRRGRQLAGQKTISTSARSVYETAGPDGPGVITVAIDTAAKNHGRRGHGIGGTGPAGQDTAR